MGWFTDLFDEKPKAKSKPATVKVEEVEVKEESKYTNFDITGKLTYEFVDRVNDEEYKRELVEWKKAERTPFRHIKPYRYLAKFTYDIFANSTQINDSFCLGLSKYDDERESLLALFKAIEELKDGSGEHLMDTIKKYVKGSIVKHYEDMKIEDLRARLDDDFNEDYITLNFQVKVEEEKL